MERPPVTGRPKILYTCLGFSRQAALFALILGLGEALQLGHQDDADQRCGEAAVIQAVAAVQRGHGGNQQIVHNGSNKAIAPAVLIRNGAQAVGIAQTHTDRLGVDGTGEGAAGELAQPAENEAGCHVTGHNGPHIAGVGTGIAGSQHAEDDTEGNAVKGGQCNH